MKQPGILLAAWITLFGSASPGSHAATVTPFQEARPFSLAVLRRDGQVIPFAVFDGRWKTPWPQGLPLELPISLTDVPKRWWGVDEPFERMDLWRDGQRVGEVTITGLSVSRPMCQPRVVLKSDHKPSLPAQRTGMPPSSRSRTNSIAWKPRLPAASAAGGIR
jgi:hypothetical protein